MLHGAGDFLFCPFGAGRFSLTPLVLDKGAGGVVLRPRPMCALHASIDVIWGLGEKNTLEACRTVDGLAYTCGP